MQYRDTHPPLEEIEFLARSPHRVRVLDAVARRAQSRADLLAMTDVSQSTMGRTLRAFEDRGWIRRDGRHYEATQAGAFVATGMRDLVDRLETELTLRDICRWLPPPESGFTMELCADATVTVADAEDPYRPITRFRSLLGKTERLRFAGFDLALLEPSRDDLTNNILEGMRTEIIDPPHVVQHIRSNYPEQFEAVLESGNLTLRVHDDLPPYGLGLFDDRVVISGYDSESGTVRALVDTDAPAAREWAESTYLDYRRTIPTVAIEPGVR